MRDLGAAILRVGDIVEFHDHSNPPPTKEWNPEIVKEIFIVEEFDDKDGTPVLSVAWQAIRDYSCLVIVVGTEHWARNDQIRPILLDAQRNQARTLLG